MSELLERGEIAELARSARRAMQYAESIIGYYVGDCKISFEPRVVVDGSELGTLIDLQDKKVVVNSAMYKALLNVPGMPRRFPSYVLSLNLSKNLAEEQIAISSGPEAHEIFSMLKQEQREESAVHAFVRSTEGPATANALLKLGALIVLHDENDEGIRWRKFATPYLQYQLSLDYSKMVGTETNEQLRGLDLASEIGRAEDCLRLSGNFHEYTLRYIDHISNRTKDSRVQFELLSDIFASAIIDTASKPALREKIGRFFFEQITKQAALEIAYCNEIPSMIAMGQRHRGPDMPTLLSGVKRSYEELKKKPVFN
jgi:hypothetical protein